MRFYQKVLILFSICLLWSCGGEVKETTPVQTLKAYVNAVKKKDTAMMKMLLSEASLKIHKEQAKAQNVSLDEIIQRETLFPADQRKFNYRNSKIEDKTATVEVKNNLDGWDIIYLVKEDNIWKIDKKEFSQKIIEQNEQDQQKLDDTINDGRINPDDVDDSQDSGNTTEQDTQNNRNNENPDTNDQTNQSKSPNDSNTQQLPPPPPPPSGNGG